jgi:hypothetical protein
MTYYTFRQNNSGGVFVAPAINLVVKADSPEQADAIALANGIYFDTEYQQDCECCGQRWYNASEWDKVDAIPEVSDWDTMFSKSDDVPAQLVIE